MTISRTPTDRLNEFVELAFGGRAAAFAKALGWQRGSVYKYLSGERPPGKAFLVDIERLGGSAAYIREGRGTIYAGNHAGELLQARVEGGAAPRTSEHSPTYTARTRAPRAVPLLHIPTDSLGTARTEGKIALEELLAAGAESPAAVLFEGRVVIVDRERSPRSGDTVLARVGERTVLRRYTTRRRAAVLAPLADDDDEIPLAPTLPYTLIGVVRALCTLIEPC